MKQQSLSRHFLIGVALLSAGVTVLSAIGGYLAFRHELVDRQLTFLNDYVRERSRNIDRRFSNLTSLQTAAGVELTRRMSAMTPREADRLLDLDYPLQADGTRRSRPQAFDGQHQSNGEQVYGIGALIADAAHMTDEDKRAFAAAFEIVSNFGEASHRDYDNLYFTTPPKTRLVMFGPDRPDRLMFYRHDAPANLDISKESMMAMTTPAMDPARATRCTDLQRLVQDTHGERLATACMTPVYDDGRYVGAFGSSIDLAGFFLSAVGDTLPGALSLVTTADGELIASPAFATRAVAPPSAIEAYQKKIGLDQIMPALKRDGRESGVMTSPDGRHIVAYARLTGPNWYFLMLYPKAAVAQSAARSASWVLAIGFIAAGVQTLLLMLLSRRLLVGPIEALAAACSADGAGEGRLDNTDRIQARPDEIGLLARTLSAERAKVVSILSSLEQRVSDRTIELERANAEKSRFLANMSHELRTPLNGVIAVSQTLADRQTTPRDRELADLILSSGRLLERVLTDILDFSKIEAGEISLSEEPFDVAEMVGRIAALHQAAAEAKGLSFGWDVSDDARGYYLGDPVRLTQVLSNLLSNAVKFTSVGSVRLSVTRPDGVVTFTVRDTGIGFDDEVKARLFRRFEQADSSIRRRFGGTGLGLAISRALMERMGGAVTASSTPGEGSTFIASAPLTPSKNGGAALEDEIAGEREEISLEGVRILLAEDHPTNQRVIQLILEPFGVDLHIVENGRMALEHFAGSPLDLVLMDMQMPELDGLEATRGLRALEAESGRPRTPVIMLTANALEDHVRESLAAGADRHISKPVNAAALLDAIADLLILRATATLSAAA
jgi:signal transduction histidine kinase/ActR/RegA family two-component response regulator